MSKRTLILLFCLTVVTGPVLSSFNSFTLAEEQKAPVEQAEAARQDPKAELEQNIISLKERLQTYQQSETEQVAKGLKVTVEQLKERTDTLKEILDAAKRHLLALNKQGDLIKEKEDLQQSVTTGTAYELPEKPPFNLKVYDDYYQHLIESRSDLQNINMARTLAGKSLERTENRVDEAGRQKRNLRDELNDEKNPDNALQIKWELSLAELEEELALNLLALQKTTLHNLDLEIDIAKIKVETAKQIVDRIRTQLHYDEADYEKQLDSIEQKKTELQTTIQTLIRKQRESDRVFVALQQRTDNAGEEDPLAKEKLAAAELWRRTYQRKLEQYENMIRLLNIQKQLWKQRYELIRTDVDDSTIAEWEHESGPQYDDLQRTIALEQNRQLNLQQDIGKIEDRLLENSLDDKMKTALVGQRQALRSLMESSAAHLVLLSSVSQMQQRFLDEMDMKLKQFSLAETFDRVADKIAWFWKLEIVVVDDQGITVGKVVSALLLIIIGFIVARYLIMGLHTRLIRRMRMSLSAAAITEKLLFYFALLIVFLFALRILRVPLTAFTFLGGAVAIGVGFGAQKLINNFISGFILMAEQPIKVGDLVQMENTLGKIDEIGVRSTRVRTYANINILVPNSYFLENNIINWTHSDNIVRGQVTVGVIYGSPVREVEKLLLRAAGDHREVLTTPDPYVYFNDFGDNALIFDVYFWLTVERLDDRRRIESEIRYSIDELFREAGLVIAFPQRDVHLDTIRPLQVQLMESQKINKPAKQENTTKEE